MIALYLTFKLMYVLVMACFWIPVGTLIALYWMLKVGVLVTWYLILGVVMVVTFIVMLVREFRGHREERRLIEA